MRYAPDQETVDVELFVLGGRTDRAIRVRLADELGDDEGTWVPLSQIEDIFDDDGPVDLAELDHGDVATFTVPEWLAEREGWS